MFNLNKTKTQQGDETLSGDRKQRNNKTVIQVLPLLSLQNIETLHLDVQQ